MRAVISRSRDDITQGFCILVEENPVTDAGGFLCGSLQGFFFLLQRFLQFVRADPWTLAISLVELDKIEIGALGDGPIHFQARSFLSQFLEVPLFLLVMRSGGRHSLGYFQLVVHVKALLGHITTILLSLLLCLPLPPLDLQPRIDFQPRRAVLWHRPGYVLMCGVAEHGGRVDGVEGGFGVQHANKIMTPFKLYPYIREIEMHQSFNITRKGSHRSRAKLRAARTTFSAQGSRVRLERGGRAANLMVCMYLEVAGFLMTSWMVAEGQFYLIYWDYDFLRSTSLRVCVRHCRKPFEQLFVLSFLLQITLCNLARSYPQRSSSSDQESDPPSYSSEARSKASSFLISLRIFRKSSLSSLHYILPFRVSSCVRMSCRDTSFLSLSKTSVLLLSLRLSSLMVRVLAGLLLLRRNYFAEPPLRFFMPVSTFAFAFIVGNRISSCPYRQKPCATACPSYSRCFSVRGRCLDYLVSYNPLETQKVKAMGILTFHSIWARAVFLLAQLTVKIDRRQLNRGDFCYISLASARDLKYSCFPGGCSGPQQNNPFFDECAWKSKQNCSADRWLRLSWVANQLSAVISGKTCLLSMWNCLFRSFPLKLVRKLPATTPSGFSMGTIWKTKLERSCRLMGSLLARKRSSPQMMKEEWGYPGWMRPVIRTTFFLFTSQQLDESEFSSSQRLVMVSRGTSSPPSVSVNFPCQTHRFAVVSSFITL